MPRSKVADSGPLPRATIDLYWWLCLARIHWRERWRWETEKRRAVWGEI